MKKVIYLFLVFVIVFYSCEKDTPTDENVKQKNVVGLVEKGPFISGSSVNIYELDNHLNGTGRVFEAKTDDEGAFSINTSTSRGLQYIKLSVNGFYFNEFTGKLSDAPIVLEALADVSQTESANINVNVLTHLEASRVLKLVSSGISFQDAKQQAQRELLDAFLITNKSLKPEEISITDNNTYANILLAVSSILLNGRSDAQFSEFMSEIRDDLVDGAISAEMKPKIVQSSLGLNHTQIKEHIKNRYAELGKTVEIGAFELFIDGNGDGQIGDFYEEDTPAIIVEEYLLSEENAKSVLTETLASIYSFAQNQYLFDAIYSNSIVINNFDSYELQAIYNHDINPNANIINELWKTAYQSINRINQLIYLLRKSEKDWAARYVDYARTYRAYLYLNMINLWGDIPLIIVSPSSINEVIDFSRISQSEVLDFIISELNNTYSHLPDEVPFPECTKYFAQSILARAYLHRADYNLALQCVADIVNSGKYTLNAESIFELPNENNYSGVWYRKWIQKGDYMPVYRYVETLLTAAEAAYRTGNTAQSLAFLNQIRQRIGLENISSITEEILLNAWQTELKNEGLHFFTVKRLGKAVQILNIPEYKLLLPIPDREITLNPKMTQNPGW